jgi:hypothetical protein
MNFFFGDAQDEAAHYAEQFGYRLGQFPVSHIGIPINYWRLTNAEWEQVEKMITKKIEKENCCLLEKD